MMAENTEKSLEWRLMFLSFMPFQIRFCRLSILEFFAAFFTKYTRASVFWVVEDLYFSMILMKPVYTFDRPTSSELVPTFFLSSS